MANQILMTKKENNVTKKKRKKERKRIGIRNSANFYIYKRNPPEILISVCEGRATYVIEEEIFARARNNGIINTF